MKFAAVPLLLLLFCTSAQNKSSLEQKPAKTHHRLLIAECAEDGLNAVIPDDQPRTRIARFGDLDLDAAFGPGGGDDGATVWFVREGKTIFSFTAKDLSADGVWIAVDHPNDPTRGPNRIALTYSDGGAIGGFHVRVFSIDGDVVTDVSKAIDGAVADFKARHYCKERGNNVTALKWINNDLLLMTEVYPTGDCGADLGYIEAYRVSVPGGKIEKHLTFKQLKRYPGVCLENDDDDRE